MSSQTRIDPFGQEAAARIKLLEQQADKAEGEAWKKLDLRVSELRSDRERRAGLLKQAWA